MIKKGNAQGGQGQSWTVHVYVLNSDFPDMLPEEEDILLPVNLQNIPDPIQDFRQPPVFNPPPVVPDPNWDNWVVQANNVHAANWDENAAHIQPLVLQQQEQHQFSHSSLESNSSASSVNFAPGHGADMEVVLPLDFRANKWVWKYRVWTCTFSSHDCTRSVTSTLRGCPKFLSYTGL